MANLVSQQTFDNPLSGELVGSVTAVQCPTIPCRLVKIKAFASNAGKVYLGFTSGVTVKAGATNTTTGFPLSAGEETGWIPVNNLNKFYRICDNAGDGCAYWTME